MSSEDPIAERSGEPTVRETIRTVSPGYRGRFDAEMHTVGLLYAVLLAILLVPLLPFIAILWVVWRVGRAIRASVGEDEAPGRASRRRGRTS